MKHFEENTAEIKVIDKLAKVNETQESGENTMMKLQNTTADMEKRNLKILARVKNMEKENEDAKKLPKLSEIKPNDRKIELCKSGRYSLNMMGVVDRTTKQMKGYKLFLSDDTGMIYIGSGDELQISKERLIKAGNSSVLKVVNKFQVNFSENSLKTAFERAKEFAEISEQASCNDLEKNVTEVYQELVKYVISYTKIKKHEEELDIQYDPEANVVSIRDKEMQRLLDSIDPSYTKVKFCKKLVLIEDCIDEKIIVRNRVGNKGYGYNTTGNKMYYKFRVVDKLMGIGA